MNRDELFRRTREILNPDLAARQTFLVIGVGSGGARVAEELVRFGAGTILLVDRTGETLEEHNLIRHPLGYSDLGRSKVVALRDRLLNTNPACEVQTFEMDVTRDALGLADLVGRATQVLLCTDNEPSKRAVNATVVDAGVPMIFAGVFDGGCGGEVGRVTKGEACYACIAAYLQRHETADAHPPETFDYTSANSTQQSTPALNIDIAQIALIQARLSLLAMLRDTEPQSDVNANYVLFGNREVPGLFPRMLSSEIWRIPRDPGCLVCGSVGQVTEEREVLAILASAEVAMNGKHVEQI